MIHGVVASWRATLVLVLTLVPQLSWGTTPTATCPADCGGDASVSIGEFLTVLGVATGRRDREDCPSLDPATPVGDEVLLSAASAIFRQCPFDDHTVSRIRSREQFFALAEQAHGRSLVKFVITSFDDDRNRGMVYFDSVFYVLHDEWYWFRLLNGRRVPGDDVEPVAGESFASVAEIYDWARGRFPLPLDLRFSSDGRLFSNRFYRLGLVDPRLYGLGSLLHVAAVDGDPPRPERWLFQLEFIDVITYDQLVDFFAVVESTVPPEIAAAVAWVVRSPEQEALARQIEINQLPLHDRIVRFSELAVPGEVEVYSAGLTAGRLRLFEAARGGLSSARAEDVVVVDAVPDFLPPIAGLVTAVPQTPLAHINLLARNRGIPNAYRAGAFADPFFQQLGEIGAPVAVRAEEPDRLSVVALTEGEYQTWLALRQVAPVAVPQIDLGQAPYTVDLAALTLADIDAVQPLLGGKSAGFLALMAVDSVTTPDDPIAISIRAYAEHVEPLRPSIEAMLEDAFFAGSVPIRYLVLEGPGAYAERYPTEDDDLRRIQFLGGRPPGHPVGDLVRAGGLKRVIRDRPIAPATLAIVRQALEAHFGNFAVTQGLRFRSSSTVEDIEGFTGAGLYTSSTGFFDAEAQDDPDDRDHTIEWALLRTWASYWSAEAFEERRLAAVDHLSGNMGVLVHARFDDPAEIANGVIIFTLLPPGFADEGVMEVNAQAGATSVTNPDPESSDLPEVDRVRQPGGGGDLVVERVRPSTLVEPGEVVFEDDTLRELFRQTREVTEAFLAQENEERRPSQAARLQTLDFEVRDMSAGWPALREGPAFGRRLVLKQARSLEPGLRAIPPALLSSDVPRDVLARAQRVESRRCVADAVSIAALEVYTNPLVAPDLGHAVVPFTASVTIEFTGDVPALGRSSGEQIGLTHLDLATVEHPGLGGGSPWSLAVTLAAASAQAERLTDASVSVDGAYRLADGGAVLEGADASCQVELLYATPEEYLRTVIEAR